MKVSVYPREDQPDKDGLCKLIIRVSDKTSRKYIATDYKVRPKGQFKNGKVINHPDAGEINSALANLLHELSNSNHKPSGPVTFNSFCQAFITHHEKAGTRGKATITYYKAELKKFLAFHPDLAINKITPDIIKSYIVHMKGRGNHHNTTWKSLKFLKTVFNEAVKDGVISASPLKKMEGLAYKQSEREFLTAEEVKAIVSLDIEKGNPLSSVRTWFLFQCFTGIRAGDLVQVNRDKIVSEGRIVIATNKTGKLISQPLSSDVRDLLKDFEPFTISLQAYNRLLKALGIAAKIKKPLRSHIARHAFAIRLAELKISKEVAGMLLGHSKASTTEIYYKIQNSRVDEEMKGFTY